MVSFFAELKIFIFRPKTMDYSPWFRFWESEKVRRKVCHPKVIEKRNLMALLSVAWHLPVGSYELLKFRLHCTFEWGNKSGD